MNKMSCEERIGTELKDRIKDVKEILKAEDPTDELNNYALALSERKVYRLELSYGGPQDYFDFEEEEGKLESITYHFLDWFDHAERNIPYDSKEWTILEELFYACIKIE